MSGLYLALPVDYSDDDPMLEAGERAELLWIRARCFMKRKLTDGRISDVQLKRLGLPGIQARADQLCTVGLWERVDGGFRDRSFLETNPSAAQVEAEQSSKSTGGLLGNHRRWHREQPSADCRYCIATESDNRSVERSDTESPKTETEPKPSHREAIPTATDGEEGAMTIYRSLGGRDSAGARRAIRSMVSQWPFDRVEAALRRESEIDPNTRTLLSRTRDDLLEEDKELAYETRHGRWDYLDADTIRDDPETNDWSRNTTPSG